MNHRESVPLIIKSSMAYFAILFHKLFHYDLGGTACTVVNGSSLDELRRECTALGGYQPTYREMISPVTGTPTLFEIFLSVTEAKSYGTFIDGFIGTRNYGICHVRNGSAIVQGRTIDQQIEYDLVGHVANQSMLTITFPLTKLINVKRQMNGQMQDYALFYTGMEAYSFHFKCKSMNYFIESSHSQAIEQCEAHGGLDSYAEFDTPDRGIWTAEKFINTSAVIDESGKTRTVPGPVVRLAIPFDVCDNDIYWQSDYRGKTYEYVCCFDYHERMLILIVIVVCFLFAFHLSLQALRRFCSVD